MSVPHWIAKAWREAIPPEPERSVVKWAEINVKLPGSAKSASFDSSITPWNRVPLECLDDGVTRRLTFVKPIQSGGSVIGEVALCYWLATQSSGDIQYNWEDDIKAAERWDKRIDRILKATPAVMKRAPSIDTLEGRNKWKKGLVMFPHCNLTVQGVTAESNLDSDSIRFQINEEIHNWEPGRLEMAYGRTTAFWNSFVLNISNASKEGDQLHQAYLAGTQEVLEVHCPGCGGYHSMRTRWDEKRPDLGGLRYDSAKAKNENGSYNYNVLAPTIRYQMPCGYMVRDDINERRALSMSCRWSEPKNRNAPKSERSFNYEAVSVDYIPWLSLIREKHDALRALKFGDPKPWRDYRTRRECQFYNPEERPASKPIVLNLKARKSRNGLDGRFARFFALDKQRGIASRGDGSHWWLVIRDVMPNGDSMLVYEGKISTDDEVLRILKEHDCKMRCGVADSGDDTDHVYQFCYSNGIHAIKGGKQDLWQHEDGSTRIFSPERALASMMPQGTLLKYPIGNDGKTYHIDEPLYLLYSKSGVRDRLAWLRSDQSEIKWEVPEDVSEDYQSHMDSEEPYTAKHPKTGETMIGYRQIRERNDLYVCECYIALMMDYAGIIGSNIVSKEYAALQSKSQ